MSAIRCREYTAQATGELIESVKFSPGVYRSKRTSIREEDIRGGGGRFFYSASASFLLFRRLLLLWWKGRGREGLNKKR
jgi:hypothetical protein